MANPKRISVTLKKSDIGSPTVHQDSVRGLGLRWTGHTASVEDTPHVREIISEVEHLLRIEDVWDFTKLSSTEKEEINKKGAALAKMPMEYATPIYIADHAMPADPDIINNGTGSLILIDGRQYCVTNWHVIEKYRQRKKNEPNLSCHVGSVRLDPLQRLIAEDRTLDLAVIDIDDLTAEEIALPGNIPTNFIEMREWPPRAPLVGNFVMFGGYPKGQRESGGREVEFGSLSSGAAYVYDSNDRNIICQVERDRIESLGFGDQGELGEIGGISGGPVIMEHQSEGGVITLEVVGFVYEYSDGFDALRIRPARFLNRDGTINNP